MRGNFFSQSTYEATRKALAKGEKITFDTDNMDRMDMRAVGYAMLDHVTIRLG